MELGWSWRLTEPQFPVWHVFTSQSNKRDAFSDGANGNQDVHIAVLIAQQPSLSAAVAVTPGVVPGQEETPSTSGK